MRKAFLLLASLSQIVLAPRATADERTFLPPVSRLKARVVICRDVQATDAFTPQPEKLLPLIDRGVLELTGKTNLTDAWKTLVSTNDVIGIKVYSAPGGQSGTRPAVVAALLESLFAGGISSSNIIVWDKNLVDLRLSGFSELAEKYKIKIAGSAQAGYDEKGFYESPLLGNLVWGDFEFEKKGDAVGRKSFISKLISQQITKIINVTPLLNHNTAGVTGNLFSLAQGSVDNFLRFEANPERLSVAVPEIFALPELGDRVALNIVDALICQYQGEQRSLLHYSAALNELRFSKDPVALDVLSLQELDKQRALAKIPVEKRSRELYQNASLLELGVAETNRISVEFIEQIAPQ